MTTPRPSSGTPARLSPSIDPPSELSSSASSPSCSRPGRSAWRNDVAGLEADDAWALGGEDAAAAQATADVVEARHDADVRRRLGAGREPQDHADFVVWGAAFVELPQAGIHGHCRTAMVRTRGRLVCASPHRPAARSRVSCRDAMRRPRRSVFASGFGVVSRREMEQAEHFYADLVGRPVSRHQTMSRFAPAETNEPALNEQAYGSAEMWNRPPRRSGQAHRSAGDHRAGPREQLPMGGRSRAARALTGGGVQIAQQVSPNGLFEIPSGTSSQATLSAVHRGGGVPVDGALASRDGRRSGGQAWCPAQSRSRRGCARRSGPSCRRSRATASPATTWRSTAPGPTREGRGRGRSLARLDDQLGQARQVQRSGEAAQMARPLHAARPDHRKPSRQLRRR